MKTPVVEQIFGSNKAPLEEVLAADFGDIEADIAAAEAKAAALPATCSSDADLAAIGNCVADLRSLSKRIDGVRMEEGRPLLEAQRGINDFFKTFAARIDRATAGAQRAADDYNRRKAAEERARREREAAEQRRKEEEARAKAEAARSAAAAARAEGVADLAAFRAERAEQAATASTADLVRTRAAGVTASAKTIWDFRITDYAALSASLGPLGPFIDRASVEKAIRSMVRIQKGATTLPGVEAFEDIQSTFRR